MRPTALVVHGHFYQPPRENPWTEEVTREPSAAPFHDWNARIAAESYRPNAFARILDDRGRVVAIVNNYEHLSFDVGPTLTSWLERHDPEAYRRIVEADAKGGGGIAQAFFHTILPLASERDIRTQVRWGMAEFEHRFGRRTEGLWLPETAVNDTVLAVLAEEGVGFTVLAPSQARRWRRAGDRRWTHVAHGGIDTRRTYRWRHPGRADLGVDLVFYDGGLSHLVAFELGTQSSQALLDRVEAATGGEGGLVTIAADGETFGHHHHFTDRLVAYALVVEAPRRRLRLTSLAGHLAEAPPGHEVQVRESAWSCAHGVGRWKEDCGCSTGGQPGWNQRWRAPLRAALDVAASAVDEVFERRGRRVMVDPWCARDAYIAVLLGRVDREAFAARHVTGDPVEAFTLLEAQRHRMAMYTSCGWFFNDLSGIETVQVLRYAARALDCLEEIGEDPPLERFMAELGRAESNVAVKGDGRVIWSTEVQTARVDPPRVVAHIALVELLEGRTETGRVGIHDVELTEHHHLERGAEAGRGPVATDEMPPGPRGPFRADEAGRVQLCCARVVLTHSRTGRRTEHVYAALHPGALDVLGATRPADPARDPSDFEDLRRAFAAGESPRALVSLVTERFGPRQFDLSSALPDTPEQILRRAAQALTDRFAVEYDRLFSDHLSTLVMLAATGYPLPAELRAPAEMALARRVEAEVAALGGPLQPDRHARAVALAREARAIGLVLDTPRARSAAERLILEAVNGAVRDPAEVDQALAALEVATQLGLDPSLERAQEALYDVLVAMTPDQRAACPLSRLGEALGLAVESLGEPR